MKPVAPVTKSDEKPDVPRKASETNLDQYPVTPKAHDLLKKKGMAFDQYLRARLVANAKSKGAQLVAAETEQAITDRIQAKAAQQEQRTELLNVHRDETAPSATVACGEGMEEELQSEWKCKETFQPNEWNVVRDSETVKRKDGSVVTRGSYVVTPKGTIVPLCRKCMRDFQEAGRDSDLDTHSFTHAHAQRISAEIKREQDQKKSFQKMGRDRMPRPGTANFSGWLRKDR